MASTKRETSRGFSVSDAASTSMSQTASETTLFTTIVPAGAMGLTKELNFRLVCSLSSGITNPTLTIKVKLGSSILTIVSAIAISISLSSKPFIIEGTIANTGTTNSQVVFGQIQQGGTVFVGQSIVADIANWTIDTTVDQTFAITATFGASLSGTTLTFKHASVDLV